MPFYLDGKLFALKNQADPQIFLSALADRLNQQGRVLQQMLVNGESIQEDWVHVLQKTPASATVSFISISASQLLNHSIAEMLAVLPQLAINLKEVARFLQTGEDDKAFPLISNSVNGLESYVQMLTLIAQYFPAQAANTAHYLDPLVGWLQQLMAAWQSEDFVLMADYLLYEIEPQLQHGHRWLQTVAT